MAVTDSRTHGYLSVTESSGTGAPEPVIRRWLSGITGIPLELVRRRWIPKPGTMPGIGTDWVAVGIDKVTTHGTPYQREHKGDLQDPESGTITRESHQTLRVIASFYGPNAAEIADAFREGIQLGQNNNLLQRYGLTLQGVVEDVQHLPDFLAEQWVDRYDVHFDIGRKVARTYGVRDIAGLGDIVIHSEKGQL